MTGLISLWKSCGMRCDAVAMFGVGMVRRWGSMVLALLCL